MGDFLDWKINECQYCLKDIDKVGEIEDLQCYHSYHKTCLIKMIEEGATVCNTCKRELKEQLIFPHDEKKKSLIIPDTDCKEIPTCHICFNEMEVYETLKCGHVFCLTCIESSLKVSNQNLAGLKCLDSSCNGEFFFDIFKKYDQLCELFIKKNYETLNCPSCNNVLGKDQNDQFYHYQSCPSCYQLICFSCNQKMHEEGEGCPQVINFIKQAPENFRINFCPNCLCPFLKDDNCERVNCSKCKFEFCFRCACNNLSVKGHANHYHRPDCKFYSKKWADFENGQEIMEDDPLDIKCLECIKYKEPCKRPGSYKEFCLKKLGVPEKVYESKLLKNLI
jgi:hypothetical protein